MTDQIPNQPLSSSTSPREPIAIVGIGCRFPQAANPRELWELIAQGRSAIREVPPDRFPIDAFHDPRPAARGKLSSRRGGFIADPWSFDAERFAISPREAARIDPQHRLMLEVASEAFEDAFMSKAELAQYTAGVYVGCWASDWECHEYADRDNTDVYSMPGAARCLISGRVSFAFDLRGPSLTVDAGCSASLIATHLACQSIWVGECSLAVCGGVNLVLDPKPGISFSLAGMLALDGQCKAYDNHADGFVRSDGCGVVVLMPLRLALARGSRIYAVIRGSGASNDGFSNGLLATPSEVGQEAALRAAYRIAGFSPRDVQYVEGHGTGTRAGDPVELRALGAVMRERAPEDPCIVGSIKTNIGHTEGAAGVAGLIKTALALHHRVIPQSLHFESPTSLVDWSTLNLSVADRNQPWPTGTARAGVSSFGISGTDVHMLLEEASSSARPAATTIEGRSQLLLISGCGEAALRDGVAAYRALLEKPAAESGSLQDICFTAAHGRDHFARRLAVVGESREAMLQALAAFDAGDPHPALSVERAAAAPDGLVFVFSGQGSQWLGMGLSLMLSEPCFRSALEACDAALQPHTGWSLLDALRRPPTAGPLGIDVIQPSIFAIQVALAALLRSFGVTPDVVVGHSMGEVAAAHIAGAIRLEDAARIICHRSRVLENVTGQGGMLSVELGFEEALELLTPYQGRVSVAAENGVHTTVLSGEHEALAEISRTLAAREVFCREVQVAAAAHSPQLDPQLAWLRRVLDPVTARQAHTALCSTVTGTLLDGERLDADYWVRNMREPVRFCAAVQMLLEQGHSRFVEISPHPVVLGPIQQIAQSVRRQAITLSTLRRELDERDQLLLGLARLHTLGHPVDFRPLFEGARFVPLPGYAMQRERYDAMPRASRLDARAGADAASLGGALRSSLNPKTYLWETTLCDDDASYLTDHRVSGAAAIPGAAFVDMALQAATQVFGTKQLVVEQLELTTALVLPPQSEVRLQVALCREQPGIAKIRFQTPQPGSDGLYREHAMASARLLEVTPTQPASLDLEGVQARCQEFELDKHYRAASNHGIEYGPAFQGLKAVWVSEREAIARVELPGRVSFHEDAHVVHPALLDACWQTAVSLLFSHATGNALYLPVAIESIQCFARPGTQVFAHAELRTALDAPEVMLDVSVYDPEGNALLVTSGLKLRQVAAQASLDDAVYAQHWREAPRSQAAVLDKDLTGQTWLILMDRTRRVGEHVVQALAARGARCVQAYADGRASATALAVDPSLPETLGPLADAAVSGNALHALVDLWPLDSVSTAAASGEQLMAEQDVGVIGLTFLLQALEARGVSSLKAWVITADTQPVLDQQAIEIAQAPLWALARVLRVELPEIELQCVDLSSSSTPGELDQLLEQLTDPAAPHEDHLALRGDQRFVMRWVRAPLPATTGSAAVVSSRTPEPDAAFQLTMPGPGILDELQLRECERLQPGPEEVEIEVAAAGLNFIDVMRALGIYPGADDQPLVFGGECAGRISALGPDVHDLQLGQAVVAMGMSGARQGAFGRYCVTRACLTVPLPANVSFAQGAAIPAVFLTAHYALHTLGHLAAGERVLVHSAAGGVGLAALALARRAGAEVVATAGSEVKRQYLRDLGVEHVFDSRSTSFAAAIRDVTGGEGVDLVLNSLAGEAIPASLGLLRDDGRFLEIGKRDIYADMQLGLSPFKRGLMFTHIDLARLVRDRPALMGRLLRELVDQFARGELQPPPVETFPISQAATAFRHMAQAMHIGKIVLTLDDPDLAEHVLPSLALVRSDASYLITGGLSGIGLLCAQWLADRGARHLILLARRAAGEQALEVLERLRAQGVQVLVQSCDVSCDDQLAQALTQAEQRMPALRGVIHSAGLLDDGLARKQTRERFLGVMRPKVLGAFNLHRRTLEQPLEFFVMFSSGAAALGSPGQANYAAANEFMDALAHARRRMGLPGLAIDWGTWSEVGMATGAERAGRLLLRGMGTMSNRQGLQLLEALMRSDRARAICLVNADVRLWIQYNPTAASGGMLDELLTALPARSEDNGLRAAILAAAPEERLELVTRHVVEVVRLVLRIPASKSLELDVPLNHFGLDSLMAVEMKNRLEFDFCVQLQVSKILLCTGLQQLSAELLDALGAAARGSAEPPASGTTPQSHNGETLGGVFAELEAGAELLDDDALAEGPTLT